MNAAYVRGERPMSAQTARKLDRIPMLAGLVAVTLHGEGELERSRVHGTYACYRAGCRCEPCRLANSDRVREWSHAVGRNKSRRADAAARRGVLADGR